MHSLIIACIPAGGELDFVAAPFGTLLLFILFISLSNFVPTQSARTEFAPNKWKWGTRIRWKSWNATMCVILSHSSDVNNNKRIKENQVHYSLSCLVSSRLVLFVDSLFLSFCQLFNIQMLAPMVATHWQPNVHGRIERIHFDSCAPELLSAVYVDGQRTPVNI